MNHCTGTKDHQNMGMEKSTSSIRWVSGAVFVVALLLNILLMPAEILRGDPLVWISEAKSIVFRGELALEEGAIKYGSPGQYVVKNDRNGRTYSKYGLMSSISVIPAILGGAVLGETDVVPTVSLNLWYALASAALALMLFRLTRRYTSSIPARLLLVIGCFYCSFLWYYLRAQSMELFICIYATAWYWAMVELDQPTSRTYRIRAAMAWLMVALLVHTRPMFILLGALTACWIGWDLLRQKTPAWIKHIAFYCAGPLVLIALSLATANHVRFGAWYHSGYHQWKPEEHTASLGNVATGLFGFIADPQYSVLLTFPALLLSLFAARRFWQTHRRDYVLALILCIGAILFYSLFMNWRGDWAAGPRYVLFALIPASFPCVVLLEDLLRPGQRLRLAAVCLLLAGSCFCWYQVIARGMYAWHTAVMNLDSRATLLCARESMIPPRGLVLYDLDRSSSEFENHPLLMQAKQTMSEDQYARYRDLVHSLVKPDNFYLFRSIEEEQ